MSPAHLPRVPRRARPAVALVLACLSVALGSMVAYLLVGGRLNPVEVVAADRAGDPACAAVARAWPGEVAGQSPVRTTADSPAVVAWGDPAIIARCGVTSPGPTTDECIDASGIDWVVQPLDDGTRFVTYGRSPALEVLVPHAYDPAPLLLGAFAEAGAQIEQGPRRCY